MKQIDIESIVLLTFFSIVLVAALIISTKWYTKAMYEIRADFISDVENIEELPARLEALDQ